MLDILKDYCNIYTSTANWDRKARHKLIQEWIKKEYLALPNYRELTSFLSMVEEQNIVKVSFPFESKIIFPVFDEEIFHNKNGNAMKVILLKFDFVAFLSYKNDESINLLQMALSYMPDDTELLQIQFENQKRYYEYTIHEVPCGVLYDENGANIRQTQENADSLKEFKSLCDKLNRNENVLIEKCSLYYTLWIEYLNDKSNCVDFEEYVHKRIK